VNEFLELRHGWRGIHKISCSTQWIRCYAPKPARAVEYCARLAPQIQEKFHFSTAYCDVHTAVVRGIAWLRPACAGRRHVQRRFLLIRRDHAAPEEGLEWPGLFEGNYHCFYVGLTDGNYGQDQSYRPPRIPWLVDFDLRQMHDLGCNSAWAT